MRSSSSFSASPLHLPPSPAAFFHCPSPLFPPSVAQARRPPGRGRQAPPQEPPPLRERVASDRCAAEPRVGALRDPPAGAAHHAVPPPAQLPAVNISLYISSFRPSASTLFLFGAGCSPSYVLLISYG